MIASSRPVYSPTNTVIFEVPISTAPMNMDLELTFGLIRLRMRNEESVCRGRRETHLRRGRPTALWQTESTQSLDRIPSMLRASRPAVAVGAVRAIRRSHRRIDHHRDVGAQRQIDRCFCLWQPDQLVP